MKACRVEPEQLDKMIRFIKFRRLGRGVLGEGLWVDAWAGSGCFDCLFLRIHSKLGIVAVSCLRLDFGVRSFSSYGRRAFLSGLDVDLLS